MTAKLFRILAVGAAIALAGCLGPDTPEEQLEAIQALQAKNLPMTPEEKSGLEANIAMGREALAAGNKDAAGKAFTEALAVLKRAEDTALYNKAD